MVSRPGTDRGARPIKPPHPDQSQNFITRRIRHSCQFWSRKARLTCPGLCATAAAISATAAANLKQPLRTWVDILRSFPLSPAGLCVGTCASTLRCRLIACTSVPPSQIDYLGKLTILSGRRRDCKSFVREPAIVIFFPQIVKGPALPGPVFAWPCFARSRRRRPR